MLFTFEHETELQAAADKAVRKARKEKPEPNLSYDDPEREEYQELSKFRPLYVAIGAALAGIALAIYLIRTFITPN